MSYTAHEWEHGEVVTAAKLNQLENGVAGSADGSIYQADKIEMPGNTGTAGEKSIVLSGGSGIPTDANGAESIHLGYGYSARNSNIHMGAWSLPSANIKGRYPWIVDYLDSEGRFVTYTDGQGCINSGNNHIRNNANVKAFAIGTLNLITPSGNNPNFVMGNYNWARGVMQFLFGLGLKGYTGTDVVLMCGRDADAEAGDCFVVGNGTTSGSTRTPSTAFKVTKDGDAIVQNSFGIMDTDGVVKLSLAELKKLKAFLATLPDE